MTAGSRALEENWTRAVVSLGGHERVAAEAARELAVRYAEPHRRYHDTRHVRAVLRDSGTLAGELLLPERERALLAVAAGAHDVVYDGRAGEDERRSAAWVREWLSRAGVDAAYAVRAESLVLATLSHRAPKGDLTAAALLDADLAILGASRQRYDEYRRTVRAEYAAYDEQTWRVGRAKVMSDLLAREPLYATAPARRRWEAAAKANIGRELESLE